METLRISKEGFEKPVKRQKLELSIAEKSGFLDRSESTGPTGPSGPPTIGSRHGKPGARPGDRRVENSAEFPPPISEFPSGRSNIWVWINTYENTIFNGMNIHKSQLF